MQVTKMVVIHQKDNKIKIQYKDIKLYYEHI